MTDLPALADRPTDARPALPSQWTSSHLLGDGASDGR
jgi:hypothetical protein